MFNATYRLSSLVTKERKLEMENNVIYAAWDEEDKKAIIATVDYDSFLNYCFSYLLEWYAKNNGEWNYLLEDYRMTTEELREVVTDDINHPFWKRMGIAFYEYPLIDERA